ncbi:MAG: GNAT family N-acetyltransferase, partial [Parvibaculum sp.]|uniref:GNAT family N-acetyltransferase n=1 Tax=Parvibaculum sp. TaxID=2024848 RepID=UPI002730A8AA
MPDFKSNHGFTIRQSSLADPVLLNAVRRIVRSEMGKGFPAGRSLPSGEETIVYTGPLTAPTSFAIFYETETGICWLDLLWVAPRGRRKGLASALIDVVETIAETEMKLDRLAFGTIAENAAMRALAEKRTGWRL